MEIETLSPLNISTLVEAGVLFLCNKFNDKKTEFYFFFLKYSIKKFLLLLFCCGFCYVFLSKRQNNCFFNDKQVNSLHELIVEACYFEKEYFF